MRHFLALACLLLPCAVAAQPAKKAGNRLAYLDEVNLYYPHRQFAKLTTPQWVGEEGVEAVVILAIDDMREPKKYEAFLRPILRRLKQIDGRAPVSIMTNAVDPQDPQFQAWLKEGLSLECHTLDHPCPFFKKGFAAAKETYDKCVDLMHEIPNNKPVAFRMPCCDSLNTPSPRFNAEIFNKTTAKGNYLTIDSSVFNVFTSDDPDLPKELVKTADGQERFRPYLPADRSFVNTIENYPYPYVIGGFCWQFPCVTPSDWQANHRHRPCNPQTVEDWKAALDCTVIKQGVFTMVFHPHGWIKAEQINELIDHAVAKHGKKVKFLTFKEAQARLDKNFMNGKPLREPGRKTPVFVVPNQDGVLHPIMKNALQLLAECYDGVPTLPASVDLSLTLAPFGLADRGTRLVDLDGDGQLDLMLSNEEKYEIFLREKKGWRSILAGKRGDPDALPMISRNGTNNGFFVHSGYLWWSNEDTVDLKDHVDRREIKKLLGGR